MTAEISTSQDTEGPGMTQSMSIASSFEQPGTPSEDLPCVSSQLQLKSRFSFNSSATPTPTPTPTPNPHIDLVKYSKFRPTPRTSPRQSKIPLAIKKTNNSPAAKAQPILKSNARQTPLQRLGTSAANRPKQPVTPPLTPVYTTNTNQPRRSLLSIQSLPFPEVSKKEKKIVECTVDAAFIPLPAADETETAALMEHNGSEDLIIHDSEEEAFSPEPRMDLGRFAYASCR